MFFIKRNPLWPFQRQNWYFLYVVVITENHLISTTIGKNLVNELFEKLHELIRAFRSKVYAESEPSLGSRAALKKRYASFVQFLLVCRDTDKRVIYVQE